MAISIFKRNSNGKQHTISYDIRIQDGLFWVKIDGGVIPAAFKAINEKALKQSLKINSAEVPDKEI